MLVYFDNIDNDNDTIINNSIDFPMVAEYLSVFNYGNQRYKIKTPYVLLTSILIQRR